MEQKVAKGKWNRASIDARRRQVLEMVLLNGISEQAMAEASGVHRNTIVNDVAVLRQEARSKMKDLDVIAEIGDFALKYDEVFKRMLFEASSARTPAAKSMLTAQALRAQMQKQQLLIETGVLPSAEKKITGELHLSGGLDVTKMSTDELRQHLAALRRTILDAGEN